MIRDWQCYATRRQCYQDKGPSRSLSWVSLPNFLIWPENAGKPTLYIWSKGNAPDPWESKIHFSWLSSIDPDLDQYSRINTSMKWPWRSLSTWYLYFRWLSCIKTRFLEDTSSCFALELLERLVSTFSQNRWQVCFRGAASQAKENVKSSILNRALARYE